MDGIDRIVDWHICTLSDFHWYWTGAIRYARGIAIITSQWNILFADLAVYVHPRVVAGY